MKKYLSIILVLLLSITISAQPVKKQDPKNLPPFKILLPDGSSYKVTDLPLGKPVMIMYFDPDCDHCTTYIGQLLKQIDLFSDVQIVMVTYVPLKVLKSFVEKSGLDKHPELKIGTEGSSFIVRYYYDVIQFPYVALHDSTGNLIASYESDVPPPGDLAKMIKK